MIHTMKPIYFFLNVICEFYCWCRELLWKTNL